MEHDVCVDNPNHFHKILEEGEMPLYSGCDQFTKFSATFKLYNLKTKYGWSDTSFTDLLVMIRKMLPEDNLLPSSMYEARKSLSTLGMKYEKIHACSKDCILYRNEHANLVNCPTCGRSRWKVITKEKINEGILTKEETICEGVPAKVLWYFPPIPRFQRMFQNKDMSNNLTWHAHKRVCDGFLRHPADSPAWKLVDERWPEFGNEPRNLRLALSAEFVLDPLSHEAHVEEWKKIMETAMKMFNMSIGKRGRQSVLWDMVKCQQQPDEKQCGFYVMRYMKDIIESSQPVSIPILFSEGFYSKREIDEVRKGWAKFVDDFTS